MVRFPVVRTLEGKSEVEEEEEEEEGVREEGKKSNFIQSAKAEN